MSNRNERANSEIAKCLNVILDSSLSDPRLPAFINVTSVKTAADFKHVRVNISFVPESDEEINTVLKILTKSEGFIKSELAKMVRMPAIPSLTFAFDRGEENAIRVNQLLEGLVIPPAEEEEEI